MDVCIEVLKIIYQDGKLVKVKIHWWNLGYRGKNPVRIFSTPETKEFSLEKWQEFISINVI